MPNIDPPVILSGVTRAFEGNGRRLGYPTANIQVDTDLAEGVYFGFADLGQYQHQAALIFIGTPTTVGSTTHRVEAHLLDIVDDDYHDQNLRLVVSHFHRANQHFGSTDELIAAMKADEGAARDWFGAANQ